MPEGPRVRPDEEATAIAAAQALRVARNERKQIEECVVLERTLVIIASNQTVARMQYLPGQEKELAAGFLVTEGLVEAGELEIDVRPLQPDVTEACSLTAIAPGKLETFRAYASIASGCGGALAGLTVDPLDCNRRIDLSFRVGSAVVSEAMRRLRRRSEVFRLTGGVHSASIVNARGEEIVFADDIGRHNALDKVVGACVLRGIQLTDKMALVSGRLSSELAAKCVRSGVALVASPGAPTDLALRIARATRLTLVGFARGDRMNVYSEDWRIA
jgi:FdhD protein